MAKRVNPSDYIGKRFDKLVILDIYSKELYGARRSVALCKCDCGNHYEAEVSALNAGRRKDCGCSRHGMKGARFYEIWCGIIKRCTNKNSSNYENYGGRGIKVCDEWNDFRNFKNDMHEEYIKSSEIQGEANISIERLNNNGDYTKENCIWATRVVQNNNSRQVKKYLWEGKRKSLAEIAKMEGINYRSLRTRFLYKGWTLKDSINIPIHSKKKNKNLKRYSIFGETLTLAEISRKSNIHRATLQSRINKGMTIKEAVNTPVKRRKVIQ